MTILTVLYLSVAFYLKKKKAFVFSQRALQISNLWLVSKEFVREYEDLEGKGMALLQLLSRVPLTLYIRRAQQVFVPLKLYCAS